MLSSILKSERAIAVNISIMRIFLIMGKFLEKRMSGPESGTNQIFKVVFERLDHLKEILHAEILV